MNHGEHQTMERRVFLKSTVAGVSVAATTPLFSQPSNWTAQVNQSVLQALGDSTVPFMHGAVPTSGHVRVFRAALATFFLEIRRVGAIPQIEADLAAHAPLTWEQFHELHAKVTAAGFVVPESAINRLSVMAASLPPFTNVERIHREILATLDHFADDLETNTPIAGRGILKNANLPWGGCAALTGAGAYFATWAYMYSAGFVVASVFGAPVFAAFGVVVAAAAFYCL
jgi:hypothetical protein